jgi:hypothetical protein
MCGTVCSKCCFATFQCKHVKMRDYIEFVLNVKFHRYRLFYLNTIICHFLPILCHMHGQTDKWAMLIGHTN